MQQRKRDAATEERRHQADTKLAQDKQREDALTWYIEQMSHLMLERQLWPPASDNSAPSSESNAAVVSVARTLTLAALKRLDIDRVRFVFQFLHDAGSPDHWQRAGPVTSLATIISLANADLRGVNLSRTDLHWIDLRGADVSRADLHLADLRHANLSQANLSQVDLSGAILNLTRMDGAYLSKANLTGALLSGTFLSGANLSEASLNEARLTGANLTDARLSDARLVGADLIGAILKGAALSGATLTGAKYNKRVWEHTPPTEWPDGFVPEAAGAKAVD
jgi:uncharacterized protein YjbI with pentapeptide repeats